MLISAEQQSGVRNSICPADDTLLNCNIVSTIVLCGSESMEGGPLSTPLAPI